MYQKGLRGRKNAQKAFHYYSMAAHSGHVLSMYNAAMMQLAGKGTVKWVTGRCVVGVVVWCCRSGAGTVPGCTCDALVIKSLRVSLRLTDDIQRWWC